MREYITKQLRERACVLGKQKTWISELSDEQLYDLFLRLRSDQSAKEIARYIQKVCGVLPKSTTHSVSQGILKFKRRIAHLLLTPAPESANSHAPLDSDGIDQLEGLEGMEHIAQLQSERIQRMMLEEQETGLSHTGLSKEIHALSALRKVITKTKEWDMVNEGLDPVKRRKFERKRERQQREFGKLLNSLPPGGAPAMIRATDRFLKAIKEKAITLERGPDGKWRRKDPEGTSEPKTPKRPI